MKIVLVEPRIPQNTGTIARLCVCTNVELHLIEPLGFELTESKIKRAGLDYWPYLNLTIHNNWNNFLKNENPKNMLFSTAHCQKTYFQYSYTDDTYLIFGSETDGFPDDFYERYKEKLYTIPMSGEHARTHNLANAVSIILYEGIRQLEFNHILQ